MDGGQNLNKQLPLLAIQDLEISFPNANAIVHAVKKTSLQINPGEIVGLVGESGSGKSVTALAIMRLLDKQAQWEAQQMSFLGEGQENAIDLSDLPELEMQRIRGRKIAMIFQEPMTALNPVITCGAQVVESLTLHLGLNKTEARATCLDWFARVLLPDPERIYRSFPHQLSGGQQQRVMIAMAMCCQPDLLIADEPTTALDVTVQAAVLELMRDLCSKENTALLFISHDLGVIRSLASRVLVMQSGHIVEEGSTETVFNQPQADYTKALLASRPPLDKRLHRLLMPGQEMKEVATKEKSHASEIKENSSLLEVRNLIVHFSSKKDWLGRTTDWVKAVDDLSFDLIRGESLGIVGESGSGKSTVAKAITRLVEPQSGTIHFAGQNILGLSKSDFRKTTSAIQIVFQNPYASLNPRMRVGQAILEPLTIHQPKLNIKDAREKVYQLLEQVGLDRTVYNRYPRAFSGGQRQRLAIARALITQPRLLICDEAVSALDVSIQAQVLNLLKDLQEELDFSLLFISHDLSVVRFICDRTLVMHQGKIVEFGDTDQIIDAPQMDYTKNLVAAVL